MSDLQLLERQLDGPSSPGGILPDLVKRSNSTMEEMTDRYGLPPRYADATRMEYELPKGVLGAQYTDGRNRWVIYNPDIVWASSALKEYVADHEGMHLGQPIEQLIPIFMMLNLEWDGVKYAFHLGKGLVEGLAENDVELLKGRRMGAYQELYEMSKDILDYSGITSAELYKTAIEDGPEKLVRNNLNRSYILDRIYETVGKMIEGKGLNGMITEGWLVPMGGNYARA